MKPMKSGQPAHILCGEDLSIGDRIEFGSYTISKEDIIKFASQWDPQFFHVDEERSITDGYFGGLIASGMHTLAIYQRLTVDSFVQNWDVIGGVGIRDLQFLKPVRPGDILHGFIVIKEIKLDPDRGRARVDYYGELVDQHAEIKLALTISAYVRMRNK